MDDACFVCHGCYALVKNDVLYRDREAEKSHYLEHNNDVHDPGYQKFTLPILDYVLTHFKPHHEGLDFGSGTGPVISRMLHDKGYHIQQYDPYFANNKTVLQAQYDYIVACEVVEHFYNPHKEFKMLRNMLRPDGHLICMSLLYQPDIDFKNWYYRKDPTHVFIYQEKTIEYIARNYGFKSFEITHGRRIVWR